MFSTTFAKPLGATVLLAACGDGVDGDGSVRVLLADAPSDCVDSAWVDIGTVD